ncbi:DNA polymerase I [Salisediminibacterium halotolerans]|uniref:DNA polymerase I n=1 Tax=Salisediminibacterium halotolerans TaxID=517425 RepID=UPI000EB35593|nr:DNA polymerase I [Salisediminibacterium halotolerans]RLJ80867.1 DNA polymerase I [Actinophytocola xinjiangensis]RPE84034.1 DNA polymerase I [Salisediminibacterium halotolerans]TWG37814.1 DNA polymerase I [Salisediminibacterium halotolerans]GEL09088.1 DNA polymerase [Salisediminibacterium halotolerans]
MKKLVLIDGNSIAYRAFFALPLLNNEKGVYTNAVYGFTTMILKILEEEDPTHLLVAFDAGKTTFRHETYKEYKGKREKTPSELAEQLPVMRDLLDAFQIKYYEVENYEADDIIGTLTTEAVSSGDFEVKVFTGDKDLLQLVDDGVTVALTRKGITNVDFYDLDAVKDRYGFLPKQIIDMKGLMGDSSDNIPGVPGVGEKTALKLLHEHGTLEDVYAAIDTVSGKKLKEKLEANRENAVMSKELATIMLNAPVDITWDDMARKTADQSKLSALFQELEFASLLERIGEDTSAQSADIEDLALTVVTEVTDEMLVSPSAVAVEVLEDNYHSAEIIGLALANKNGTYFLPTDTALNSEKFKQFASDSSCEKYTFNAKRAVVTLGWHGIELNGVEFDIQIASYLVDPSASSHEMADIASRKKSLHVQTDEAVYGKGKKQAVPDEAVLSQHIGRKAAAILDLKPDVETELEANHQLELFRGLEMPLSVILGQMERTGIAVNRTELEEMGERLSSKLAELEEQIHEKAGTAFNINSPKQLGEVLFEKLQLPVIKKTKTGYSTSADILEKLKDQHEIIPMILHYRQLGKLNSTYIEGLLKVIHPKTGKIHTIFNQSITQTGRLSSTEPNLQNIPVRLEEGRKIRQAFIPDRENGSIFAADYSQIELRVLAHISGDENLIEAFREGRDIHTKTAADVFDVNEDSVTTEMRRTAKAVNFGIVYGISDYGLSQNLGITRKEAQSFIETYFKSYPGVKKYMEDIVEQARENGYVTTLLNRRRYLPEITSRNFNQRSFAERTAMNTPIQGSAADIIKKAMVEMATVLEREGFRSNMLVQVHDELIFDVPNEEIEAMKERVTDIMENAIKLDVPLVAETAHGQTWYDAK